VVCNLHPSDSKIALEPETLPAVQRHDETLLPEE